MNRYVITEEGARRLRSVLNPSGRVGSRLELAMEVTNEQDFAEPFRIAWAASANGGAGTWIIWIPSPNVLTVNGSAINPAASLAAAGGDYPSGWYVIEIQDGAVYLNVHIPDAASVYLPTCSFDSSADTPEEGERVIPICVANVSKDASTGVVTVRQFVRSSIVIDNTSRAETPTPTPFMLVKSTVDGETVVNVVGNTFYFNGVETTVADYTVPAETIQNGSVYLRGVCDLSDGSWTFDMNTSPSEQSASNRVVNYKLYDFSDGDVSMDYRTTFMSATDAFGIHEIKSASGTVLAKFNGSADVTLTGGGSGITADAPFDVITAIQYDAATGYIQVKTRNANVTNGNVVSFGAESGWTDKIATTPISGS